MKDEELLAAYVGGDLQAFEELYRRYRVRIFNFLLAMVRDHAQAEELLQDVFLKVVERSTKFRGESSFATWLYTISRNRCIDHSRRMKFRKHGSLDASDARTGVALIDRVASEDSTERQAMNKTLSEQLERALAVLPSDQREVLLLRQVHGFSFKEIAEVVGASPNTVKSRMRYALERLQGELGDFKQYAKELG